MVWWFVCALAAADTGDTGSSTGGAASVGRVLINEALPAAPGDDVPAEWVELVNIDVAPISLAGWTIERAKSSWGAVYAFPAVVIEPGAYLVVGGTDVTAADLIAEELDFGNAGSNGDGIRIVDSDGAVRDTVIYGANNDDALEDDAAVATSLAPTPGDAQSIARIPDATDTDESGVDFVVLALPTPGLPNDAEAPDCGGRDTDVVINELMPDPEGTDEGFEWIELFNAGTDAEDLSGWGLVGGTSPGGVLAVFEDLVVDPGAFVLVAGELVERDDALIGSLGNAGGNSDGVVLVDCSGVPADVVVYGSPNEDGWLDEEGGLLESLAPKPQQGFSLARLADGYDTDRPGDDVIVSDTPTPGASNPTFEPPSCELSSDIRLNEILPNPAGTDDGLEFVELYNRGTVDVSLEGWQLAFATQGDDFDSVDLQLPQGAIIPAAGFYVVGGELVEERDHVAEFAIGNGTEGDGVRLFDCEGASVDTVVYGDDNLDEIPDDLGEVGDPSPLPEEDRTLGRVVDGVDSDDPRDWAVATPSPGETNARTEGELPDTDAKGCGCGGGPDDGAPPTTAAPGEGGCATLPTPLRGFEALLAVFVLLRRKRTVTVSTGR